MNIDYCFSYSRFVTSYPLEDVFLFFNWKDFFDFLYLAVTYLSIFKSCAVF